MNDERDHDTEHIEKIFGLGNREKKDNDNVEDSSATHNSTKGVANPDAGKGTIEGWGDDADGKVDDPKTTGKKPKIKNPFSGFKDDHDYKKYSDLAGSGKYSDEAYMQDALDESGTPKWRAHYEQVKENKKKRDAFAEEYRRNIGREFGPDVYWDYYNDAYGDEGFYRDEKGNVNWDDVKRGIARGHIRNQKLNATPDNKNWEDWIDPDFYALNGDSYDDMEFAERYNITEDQLQEAYRQFNETGQIDPAIFADKDTSAQEAQQVAEVIEENGGGVIPSGKGIDTETGTGTETRTETQNASASTGNRSRIVTGDRPSVTSQRIMDAGLAGLNMFGNAMGGANKAFSMLRGLASALTSRQLMSDPMLPARAFLDAMDQSGQIIGDGIKSVGEAYGIKDGVKREDLVGTYRGGQYYKERQQIEDAEKQYYEGVGNALSSVLGQNIDVNDPVAVQNALAGMDSTHLAQLDEQLFGQNGTFAPMMTELMGASNPTKVQQTQAKLMQELNKALKGQAQSVSRDAALRRRTAIADAQHGRVQLRMKGEEQADRIRDASKMIMDPNAMAGLNYNDQQSTIIEALLGNRINNKTIPYTQTGPDTADVDLNALDNQALHTLQNALSNSPLLNDKRTRMAAQSIYNTVSSRLNQAMANKKAQRQAFNQQILNSAMAPYVCSPLDLDMKFNAKNVRRDSHGIPTTAKARHDLEERAHETIWDIRHGNLTGTADDIAMCENVIAMCRMADRMEGISNDIRGAETKGFATPMELGIMRDAMLSNYDKMGQALALTKDDRDVRAMAGQPWQQGATSKAAEAGMRMVEHRAQYIMGTDRRRREAERQARRQKDIDDMRERARRREADRQSRQAVRDADEQAKADARAQEEAEWERQANRDGRGISRAPWTQDDKYRKKDLEMFNTELSMVDAEIAKASQDPVTNAYQLFGLWTRKADLQEMIRQTHQESHIQRVIAKAGQFDDATRRLIIDDANALRDSEPDWNRFGDAINKIYTDYPGLGSDRTWASSRRAEAAARAAAKQNSVLLEMQNMHRDMNTLLKGMANGIGSGMQTINGNIIAGNDLISKAKTSIVDAFRRNRKAYEDFLAGNNKKGKTFRQGIEDMLKDTIVEQMKANNKQLVEDFSKSMTDTVTDACSDIRDGIKDLDRTVTEKVEPHLSAIDWTVHNLSTKFGNYMTASDADRKRIIRDIEGMASDLADKLDTLTSTVDGLKPLGGMGVPDDQKAVKIDEAQYRDLVGKLEALEGIKTALGELKDKGTATGMNDQQVMGLLACALSGYGLSDDGKGTVDGISWDEDLTTKFKDFLDKSMTLMERQNAFYDEIDEFNRNRDTWAIPASLVDDIGVEVKNSLAQSEVPQDSFEGSRETGENPRVSETETLATEMPDGSFEEGSEDSDRSEDVYDGDLSVDAWRSGVDDILRYAPSSLGRDRAEAILTEILSTDTRNDLVDMIDYYEGQLGDGADVKAFLGKAEALAGHLNNARYRQAAGETMNTAKDGDPEQQVHDEYQNDRKAKAEEAQRKMAEEKEKTAHDKAVDKIINELGMDLSGDEDKEVLDIIRRNLLSQTVGEDGRPRGAVESLLPRTNFLNKHKSRYVNALRELNANGSDKAKQVFNRMMEGAIIPHMFGSVANTNNKVSNFDPNVAKRALEMARNGEVTDKRGTTYLVDDFSNEKLLGDYASGAYAGDRNTSRTKLQDAYRAAKAEKDFNDRVSNFRNKTITGLDTELKAHKDILDTSKTSLSDIPKYDDLKKQYEEGKIDLAGLKTLHEDLKKKMLDARAALGAVKSLNLKAYDRETVDRGGQQVSLPADVVKEITEHKKNSVDSILDDEGYEELFKMNSKAAQGIANIARLYTAMRTNEAKAQKKVAQTTGEGTGTATGTDTGGQQTFEDDTESTGPEFKFTDKQRKDNSATAEKTAKNLVKALLSNDAVRGSMKDPSKAGVEEVAKGLRQLLSTMDKEKATEQLANTMKVLGLVTEKQNIRFDPNNMGSVENRLRAVADVLINGGRNKSFGTFKATWNKAGGEQKVEEKKGPETPVTENTDTEENVEYVDADGNKVNSEDVLVDI